MVRSKIWKDNGWEISKTNETYQPTISRNLVTPRQANLKTTTTTFPVKNCEGSGISLYLQCDKLAPSSMAANRTQGQDVIQVKDFIIYGTESVCINLSCLQVLSGKKGPRHIVHMQ